MTWMLMLSDRIIRFRVHFRGIDLVHLKQKLAEAQYAIMMDALINQQLVMVVHISAADAVHEMIYESEALRHKRCNAKVLYAKSHHQKIVNRLHLENGNQNFKCVNSHSAEKHKWICSLGFTSEYTYVFSTLSHIFHAASCKQTWCFCDKFFHITLTSFPMMNWNITYITNVAHCREWWMQK